MNCHESQELLQRRLDGEQVSTSELEAHVLGCLACRRRHAAAGLLLSGLKGLPHPEPPGDLADQIVLAVLRDRVHRRLKMRRRVWITAALAASILFIAWAGNLWLPNRRPENPEQDNPPIAKKDDDKRPQESPATPEPALAQTVDEARDAVLALTGRLAGETKGQAQLFIAAAPTDVASLAAQMRILEQSTSVPEPLNPAAESFRQASLGVTQGLQTVAGNARRAVSFFVNDLPIPHSTN